MGKKKRKSPKKLPSKTQPAAAAEDRRQLVVTVLWTQATLITAVCEMGAGAIVLIFGTRPEGAWIDLLWRLLFVGALICGLVTLLLTPLVYRLRATPPPKPIAVASVAVGLAPLVVLLIAAFQ